jgi:hypothetical protein
MQMVCGHFYVHEANLLLPLPEPQLKSPSPAHFAIGGSDPGLHPLCYEYLRCKQLRNHFARMYETQNVAKLSKLL